MANRLSVGDIISNISDKCGMSEHVVREVLRAETECVCEALSRGEKVSLTGRCSMEAHERMRMVNGIPKMCFKVDCKPHRSLEDKVIMDKTTPKREEMPKEIKLYQIEALV